MEYEIINERVNKIFCTVFKDANIKVHDTMTASDVEKWDSLSHLVMISAVESEFKIRFKLKGLVAMKNVGDMLKAIETKLKG